MSDATQLVTSVFKSNNITVPDNRQNLFSQFLEEEENKSLIEAIAQNGSRLMAKWKLRERVSELMEQSLRIPNATVGKPYEVPINTEQRGWQDIAVLNFLGLEEAGLSYNKETRQIKGVPTKSGDIKITFQFKIDGEEADVPLHQKQFTLIVNPDPKTLWKNIESNKDDPYWKEDNQTVFARLGDRHILLSSKRGRSHANEGSFREDDFAFSELDNGWCIVAVSDGAGSAKLSRKGSALACETVVNFFKEQASAESMSAFDDIVLQYESEADDEVQKNLNRLVYNNLGKAAFTAHKKLEEFAKSAGASLKDLSATLIFCLFKKYQAGYVFLSFGVGDCPMAILNKDVTAVTMMNWLDVGEFGGGTRFITMPEIFQNEKFATRFSFKLVDDFSYLIMMSDGIYDPKFVVEAALPNIVKWQEFLADLNGNNPEGIKVEISTENKEMEQQFSQWMDFWSPGNHDDRTLAIVF